MTTSLRAPVIGYVPQAIAQLADASPVRSLACGQYHTAVASRSGGVFAFGKNDYGQLGLEHSEPALTPAAVTAPERRAGDGAPGGGGEGWDVAELAAG